MSSGLLEWVTGVNHHDHGFGISPGVVKDNLNLLSEGRIEVKVSAHPEFIRSRAWWGWVVAQIAALSGPRR